MKKLIAIVMALVLLCTVGATAAFAAKSPSKPSTPPVVPEKPVDDFPYGPYEPYGDGHLLDEVKSGSEARRKAWEDALAQREENRNKKYDAQIVDSNGRFIWGVNLRSDKNPYGELIITPIADALAGKADPRIDVDTLIKFYNELKNASNPASLIPELGKGYTARDMFDVALVGAAGELITLPGLSLKVTFDLNLAPEEPVLGYQANLAKTGWEKTASCKNNGSGGATVTFAHLCPVALLTKASSSVESPRTADFSVTARWSLAAICGLAAVVTLTVSRKRSKAN